MTMEIEFKEARAATIQGRDGAIRVEFVGEWNGFEEWRTTKGEKLIVFANPGGGLLRFFAGGSLPHEGSATVICGSPDLLSKLLPKDKGTA